MHFQKSEELIYFLLSDIIDDLILLILFILYNKNKNIFILKEKFLNRYKIIEIK